MSPTSFPDEQPTIPPASRPPLATEGDGLEEQPTLPFQAAGVGSLPQQLGRYVLERKLGEGGMGAVYLALDTQLQRRVALKMPTIVGPDAPVVRARFLQEARAAAALRHPNLCPIYDLGETGGVLYLTMAFIAGEPLQRRIGPGRLLPPRQAVALVRKMALALQVAHDNGVIHRDLKPANVMIDDHGEPIVMDFGLARQTLAVTAQLTQEGEVLGTPAYMPPEQVTGDVQAMGPASDVYSLGVVLYELLSGTRPFDGDLLALLSQITLDPPLPPSRRRPGLEPTWDALCLTALAKAPAQRWPSMRAMAAALDESLQPAMPAFATAPPLRMPPRESTLALRVEGTPHLYRPWQGQDVISVGRQKRLPGDPPDRGNDFVLRVAGNDQASARISRRHFEIHRTAGGHVVVDCSKAGLLLNGRPVPRGTPTPLEAGDKLLVAGVVTLEVLLLEPGFAGVVSNVVEVPSAGQAGQGGQVVLEASMGDMVTME